MNTLNQDAICKKTSCDYKDKAKVAASSNLPNGTEWADYLYWDNTQNNWKVGSSFVRLGRNAGQTNQNSEGIAIGSSAGRNNQGTDAIAIGTYSGENSQKEGAIAIGRYAGYQNQGEDAISIGVQGGPIQQINQGYRAISIGYYAGNSNQGTGSIAIGYYAGSYDQPENSIIINAGNSSLNTSVPGLFIDPIRVLQPTTNILFWDPSTKEVYAGEVTFESLEKRILELEKQIALLKK